MHKVGTSLLGMEVEFDRPGVSTPVNPEFQTNLTKEATRQL
jgi:hypothetical protein